MMLKFDFERIDITDLIVVVALSLTLIYSVHSRMMELSMSIASGLLGYIGGTVKSNTSKTENYHKPDTPVNGTSDNKVPEVPPTADSKIPTGDEGGLFK